MHTHGSWVVEDPAGKFHVRYEALLVALRASPLWFLFGYVLALIPWNRNIGEWTYNLIAQHRKRTCIVDIEKESSYWVRDLSVVSAGIFLTLVFVWNMLNLEITKTGSSDVRPDSPLRPAMDVLGIWQRWSFFAASPPIFQEWPVVRVEWSDGSATDPLQGWKPVTFERPEYPADAYGNIRWALYFGEMGRPHSARWRKFAPAYFCNLAREHLGADSEKVPLRVEFYWVQGTTPAYADWQESKTYLLSESFCKP